MKFKFEGKTFSIRFRYIPVVHNPRVLAATDDDVLHKGPYGPWEELFEHEGGLCQGSVTLRLPNKKDAEGNKIPISLSEAPHIQTVCILSTKMDGEYPALAKGHVTCVRGDVFTKKAGRKKALKDLFEKMQYPKEFKTACWEKFKATTKYL